MLMVELKDSIQAWIISSRNSCWRGLFNLAIATYVSFEVFMTGLTGFVAGVTGTIGTVTLAAPVAIPLAVMGAVVALAGFMVGLIYGADFLVALIRTIQYQRFEIYPIKVFGFTIGHGAR